MPESRELSVRIAGLCLLFRTTGRGVLHCERCGGDRRYRRIVGRVWIHLLYLPIFPLDRIDEHVQCRSCRTRYRVEVLRLPTAEQMRTALPAGSLAAVTAMLQAGDPVSPVARRRALRVLAAAGLDDYDDEALTADLAVTADIAAPLRALSRQLVGPAHEWFVADVVRVGLADGPLSRAERAAATRIAAHLGISSADAANVISRTEQSAATG